MCVTSVSNSYDMIVALRKMLDREIEVVSPDPSNLFFNFLDYELFFGKNYEIIFRLPVDFINTPLPDSTVILLPEGIVNVTPEGIVNKELFETNTFAGLVALVINLQF